MGKIIRITPQLERALWAQVLVSDEPEACWLWVGGSFADVRGWLNNHYGCGPAGIPAHKLAYVSHYEAQPGKLDVLHRCDNKLCCRPDHLFLGTPRENSDDMMSKNRHRTHSTLRRVTDEEHLVIQLSELNNSQLAAQLGLSVQTIRRHRRKA